jgi:hypothetical protein
LKTPILCTYVDHQSRLCLNEIDEAHTDHILRVPFLTGQDKVFNGQRFFTGVVFLHIPLSVFHSTTDNIFSNKKIDPKILETIKYDLDGTPGYILRLETKSSGTEGPFTKQMIVKYKKHALNGNLCYYLKIKSNGEIQFLNSKFYLIDNTFFRSIIIPLAKYSAIPVLKKRPLKEVEEEIEVEEVIESSKKTTTTTKTKDDNDKGNNHMLLLASSTAATKIRKEEEERKKKQEKKSELEKKKGN